MRMVDLIEKKKNAAEHSPAEIDFIITQYASGAIPDYQMAAWLMAVRFQSLSQAETLQLTLAMVNSGIKMDLSEIDGIKVDKHSTGGVADTTTLIVLPLVAACGLRVAKMSGRGLGFTGGTIDKLESIPGFCTTLSPRQFVDQVRRIGLAVISQSPQIAPADGKMYALRDVTATVDSLPLIASSVMSKKIAAGADKILLDVKFGGGAFMKTLDEAKELASVMVDIGNRSGRETVAVLSRMEEPLGCAIGNSLEVAEAIEILSGRGDCRLRDFCMELAQQMLLLSMASMSEPEAKRHILKAIESGAGLKKLAELVESQGGDIRVIDDQALLGQSEQVTEVMATQDGYVQTMDAALLGKASLLLGAGRARKEDSIDLRAGIRIYCHCGDPVKKGQRIASLHHARNIDPGPIRQMVFQAIRTGTDSVVKQPVIAGFVNRSGCQEFFSVH